MIRTHVLKIIIHIGLHETYYDVMIQNYIQQQRIYTISSSCLIISRFIQKIHISLYK